MHTVSEWPGLVSPRPKMSASDQKECEEQKETRTCRSRNASPQRVTSSTQAWSTGRPAHPRRRTVGHSLKRPTDLQQGNVCPQRREISIMSEETTKHGISRRGFLGTAV